MSHHGCDDEGDRENARLRRVYRENEWKRRCAASCAILEVRRPNPKCAGESAECNCCRQPGATVFLSLGAWNASQSLRLCQDCARFVAEKLREFTRVF